MEHFYIEQMEIHKTHENTARKNAENSKTADGIEYFQGKAKFHQDMYIVCFIELAKVRGEK